MRRVAGVCHLAALAAGHGLAALGTACEQRDLFVLGPARDAGARDATPDAEGGAASSVEVDWDEAIGVAGRYAYGLNVPRGLEPGIAGVPGDEGYRRAIAATRVGFVRLYAAELTDDSAHPRGWIVEGTPPRWDRDKVARALRGSYPWNPGRMITIPIWPVGLAPRGAPLPRSAHAAFAALCADLVRLVNLELGVPTRYWEVTSQLDRLYAGAGSELGALVAAAARAMRAVDPDIRVGAPGLENPWSPELPAFLDAALPDLDFVSFHTFPFGSRSAARSDAEILAEAEPIAGAAGHVGAAVAARTRRPVDLFHDELAFSADTSDERLRGIVGALFNTTVLAAIARAGAQGAALWDDASPAFGALAPDFSPRPTAHALAQLNGYFRGTLVRVTSGARAVQPHAVRSERRRALLLVHGADLPARVRVLARGGAGGDAAVAVQVLDRDGLRGAGTLARAALADAGLSLPPRSVTYLIEGDTEPDP